MKFAQILARIGLAVLPAVGAAADGREKDAWPFDQPRNTAVITHRQIVQQGLPILLVTHDADDHGWQFLNTTLSNSSANVAVVGLGQIVRLDPSVLQVADMPPGWRATRKAPGAPWVREKSPAQ